MRLTDYEEQKIFELCKPIAEYLKDKNAVEYSVEVDSSSAKIIRTKQNIVSE